MHTSIFTTENINKPTTLPPPPLYSIDIIDLKFPVSLLSYLVHNIEARVLRHLQKAWRRKEKIKKINIHLYCGHKKRIAVLEIQPPQASREFREFCYPIEKQISKISLSSPVSKIELEVLRVKN